jgi:hypothetical protein
MKLLNKMLLATMSLLPLISYAFFCPTNFKQIFPGDSIDQVTVQCGKPDKQETKKDEPPTPQEWSYYIPSTVPINVNSNAQGTLKTTMAFDANGKLINISVNGIGVGSSTVCGPNVQLGDTIDSVKANCGKPSAISKESDNDTSQKPQNTTTTFNYLKTTPPATLTFKNGLLQQP